MYSICGTTLAMALATLWVVFTPIQPIPPTTPVDDHTLPYLPPAHGILWTQSEEPIGVGLRIPTTLVNALRAEERSREMIDLRVPEALLEHLYGAGRVSGLERSPTLWHELFSDEMSVTLY
jgi:hypothetical protein